jgi:predicted nucleic acid-binding protein
MPLDVPDGEHCFLDANILYYSFVETPHSDMCRHFLKRIQQGDVEALTDVRALGDCVHKVMLAEVSERFSRPRERIIGWLKQHPEALAILPKTVEASERIQQYRLTVVSNDSVILPRIVAIAETYRLLMGDATIVALMQRHGITHLATNDDDFDRVPGIQVWKPRA